MEVFLWALFSNEKKHVLYIVRFDYQRVLCVVHGHLGWLLIINRWYLCLAWQIMVDPPKAYVSFYSRFKCRANAASIHMLECQYLCTYVHVCIYVCIFIEIYFHESICMYACYLSCTTINYMSKGCAEVKSTPSLNLSGLQVLRQVPGRNEEGRAALLYIIIISWICWS